MNKLEVLEVRRFVAYQRAAKRYREAMGSHAQGLAGAVCEK